MVAVSESAAPLRIDGHELMPAAIATGVGIFLVEPSADPPYCFTYSRVKV